MAEEAEEGLGGRGVGFAFALDDLVEFAFVEDFVKVEGHGGVWVLVGSREGMWREGGVEGGGGMEGKA